MKNKSTLLCVFTILIAIIFYAYEFFMQVAPGMIADQVIPELKISRTLFLTISIAYFYGYFFMKVIAGILLDNYGPRHTLVLAMLICGISTCWFASSEMAISLGMSRFIMGLSGSMAFVGVVFIASRLFSPNYFPLIVGIAELSGTVGGVLAEAPLRAITHVINWRPIFISLSVVLIGLSLLLYLLLRTNEEMFSIKKQYTADYLKSALRFLTGQPQIILTNVLTFFIWFTPMGFIAYWATIYLKESEHFRTLISAEGCSIAWIALGISSVITGWWSNKINNRLLPIILCAFIGFISCSVLIYLKPSSQFVTFLALAGVGVAASSVVITFSLVNDYCPPELTGVAMGLNSMYGVLAIPLAQLSINVLTKKLHLSLESALSIFPITYVIIVIIAYFFLKETHCQRVTI